MTRFKNILIIIIKISNKIYNINIIFILIFINPVIKKQDFQ